MGNLRCACCGVELTGGVDTFGEDDAPMCREDYMALIDEHEPKTLIEIVTDGDSNNE